MAFQRTQVSEFPRDAKPVTLSNDTALKNAENGNALQFGPVLPTMIWVGTAGNVTIILDGGTSLLLKSMTAGGWHGVPPFKNVQLTGTAAADVVVAIPWGA